MSDASAAAAIIAAGRVLAALPQYRWMVIAAIIFGFLMAFGIGANDVANAFATSVSAKSINLKQAVLIASVCEFLGAMLLGASVTSTIRSKVIDVDLFDDDPDVLMYGMLTSLVAASFILMIANYLALPVSTSHTIVGAVVGFSLAAKGFQSINWMTVGKIFISWVASPVVTGLFGALFFWIVRRYVLESSHPYQRAVKTFPVIVFLAIGLDAFMVLKKAGKNNDTLKNMNVGILLAIAFGGSLVLAVVFHMFISPCVQKKIERKHDLNRLQVQPSSSDESPQDDKEQKDEDGDMRKKTERTRICAPASEDNSLSSEEDSDDLVAANIENDTEDSEAPALTPAFHDDNKDRMANEEQTDSKMKRASKMMSASLHKSIHKLGEATINRDIEAQAFEKSERARDIWNSGIEYDPKAEHMFSYLQVMTACLLSFAHGANDVANAVAPLSAVILIYDTGSAESKAPVQKWVLALGGAGIVLGLLLYGYRLMISLGYKLTKLSPSRGFCIELAASTVVVVASFLGIPVSTTQCQVGGTTGVGLLGGSDQLHFWFFVKVCAGWVFSFLAVVIINAGVFAFAYYAPSAPGFE